MKSKSIGTLADVAGTNNEVPNNIDTLIEIKALKGRVSTLELLLNDVMHQLDQPSQQPKAKAKPNAKQKAKPKRPTPAEQALLALSEAPMSRQALQKAIGLDDNAFSKCLNFMTRAKLIEVSADEICTPTGKTVEEAITGKKT